MNISCSSATVTETVRAVRLLKIDGCPPYPCSSVDTEKNQYVASRWEVNGYEWETRFYPIKCCKPGINDMAVELVLISDAHGKKVTANLSCRLVDPSSVLQPSTEKISPSKSFERPSDSSEKLAVKDNSVTVECTVTAFKDPREILLPSSDMQRDFGELLRSEAGADVTFVISGESFAAHKNVLAARSPVFKAGFFGEMEEKTSKCVEIEEMEPSVFKAMLHFIYTDTVPELDEKKEIDMVMAQHLIVAADRYRLDRLKVICERKIALSIDAGMVATTLALAEQHGCSQLKAKCVEFITGGSAENLDVVVATDGFKRLASSSPSVMVELLKASHKRFKK